MGELVILAGVLACAGAAAGLIAGLLGVGGGIVIVPVLVMLLPFADVPQEVRMHLAVGTSLATIIATSIISARAHAKRGNVDFALLKRLAVPIAVGVIIGIVIGGRVSGNVLTAIFAVIALVVAVHMAFFQGRTIAPKLPRAPWLDGIGTVIGGVSVVMGIGGGTLSVPTFTLFSMPIKKAVGTAAAIGLIIAVPGAIGFAVAGWGNEALPPASLGYVNLVGFALIAPLSMALAPVGAKLAHALPAVWLSRAFALFLAATGIRMLFSLTT